MWMCVELQEGRERQIHRGDRFLLLTLKCIFSANRVAFSDHHSSLRLLVPTSFRIALGCDIIRDLIVSSFGWRESGSQSRPEAEEPPRATLSVNPGAMGPLKQIPRQPARSLISGDLVSHHAAPREMASYGT
jgi:hypothetical protein